MVENHIKCDIWQIKKAGSIARLHKTSQSLAKRKSNEVTVEVCSIGLNFADIFAVQGLYSATPRGAFVPGLEFSGFVHSCSPVSGFKKGDRVMGLTRFGAYASYINVTSEYLQKLPSSWSFNEGAAYLVQALTAWYALNELGCLKKNQLVLLHSAAGGVGLHSLRMIQKAGAHVVCTVGTPSKIGFLKEQGVKPKNIIVRDKNNFTSDLNNKLKIWDRTGFDLVLDAVAGPYLKPAMSLMSPAGRYVIFGAASFMNKRSRPNYLKLLMQHLKRPLVDPVDMISNNHSIMAFNLIWLWDQKDIMINMLTQMTKAGLLKEPPFVGHEFSFDDAPKAMAFFQTGKSVGKVVLNIHHL